MMLGKRVVRKVRDVIVLVFFVLSVGFFIRLAPIQDSSLAAGVVLTLSACAAVFFGEFVDALLGLDD